MRLLYGLLKQYGSHKTSWASNLHDHYHKTAFCRAYRIKLIDYEKNNVGRHDGVCIYSLQLQ
jgi:hypothetical protein